MGPSAAGGSTPDQSLQEKSRCTTLTSSMKQRRAFQAGARWAVREWIVRLTGFCRRELIYIGGPSIVDTSGNCIERCSHFRGKFISRKHIWDIAKCPSYRSRGALFGGVLYERLLVSFIQVHYTENVDSHGNDSEWNEDSLLTLP